MSGPGSITWIEPYPAKEVLFGLLNSLNMLIETHGGFDYTGADCTAWMREAGFKQTRVEHLGRADSMAIGVK
jgi:hypothetical protein